MRAILVAALVLLTACTFHIVVKPPPLPKHNPLAAPTVNYVPTVTATP